MQRTTIILATRLKALAMARARSSGISFGEFVRRAIKQAVAETNPGRKGRRHPLLDDGGVFRGKIPTDLSHQHDRYLYGARALKRG